LALGDAKGRFIMSRLANSVTLGGW